MQPAVICLGKIGDILSVAAMMQACGYSDLIVSRKYSDIPTNLTGIKPHVYEGDWEDLAGAIKWAKKKFRNVLVPQTYGKDFPIQHKAPSFQLDQAVRMGLKSVDGLQLRLGARIQRNGILGQGAQNHPVLLVSDHSESSPFGHADSMVQLLKDSFGSTHEIVRLSEIKLDRFTDFVEMYNQAEALVTIETSHLHLSAATTTPVFALMADQPQRWHGSAWNRRFRFSCRYNEYESRKDELITAIRDSLDKKDKPQVEVVPTRFPNGYNPSIINWQRQQLMTYRHHPDPTKWRSELAMKEGNKESVIIFPDAIQKESIEDGRLFVHQDKLCLSYNVSQYTAVAPPNSPTPSCVEYGQLERVGDLWKVVNAQRIKYGKNQWNGLEKNWLLFSQGGNLYCIYQCSPEHIVLEIQGDKVVREFKTKSPAFCKGAMRGGTQPLDHNGMWLRFFHTQALNKNSEVWWNYYMGALVMEKTPPFAIMAVSKQPILAGNEQYFYGWRYCKPNVSIPYGAVAQDQGYAVSVGINDSATALIKISQEQLNL